MRLGTRPATPDKLHQLVDALPEAEWPVAERVLRALVETSAPLPRALAEAPEDDEPETDDERAAVAAARQAVAGGEILSHEELCREVGL